MATKDQDKSTPASTPPAFAPAPNPAAILTTAATSSALSAPPSIGRVVHFVVGKGPNGGKHRPGTIVEVVDDTTVNLVWLSGSGRDFHPFAEGDTGRHTHLAQHVTLDDDGQRPDSWHWPEVV